ncbi:MAG TPA: hypothetical protein ACFYD6_10895 [Candidatus Brocadiia bacterium]|nr:hypothetical protein [Planctomycetota bacterium]MDO8093657.1 hypothetical protein [Candidatus Brocadiales bacterium]
MNEQIFEQAVNTLSIAFMAGRALTAFGAFQKKKEPLTIESKKALEESLTFIKKANTAEEVFKQARLSLSSLELFKAYTIVLETVRSRRGDLLEGRDIGIFLKTIESTIESALDGLENNNVSADDVEDARVFFSHLMHFASAKSSQLLR